MIRAGMYLAILGAAALLLPLMGMQLRFLNFMDAGTQQLVGAVALVAGVLCLAAGWKGRKPAEGTANSDAGGPAK